MRCFEQVCERWAHRRGRRIGLDEAQPDREMRFVLGPMTRVSHEGAWRSDSWLDRYRKQHLGRKREPVYYRMPVRMESLVVIVRTETDKTQ